MKQVLDVKGQISVTEVPAPSLEPGKVLVRTAFSCISTGTELSGLRASATPLWRKALDKPQHVKKVMEIARKQGISSAMEAVQAKVGVPKPLGYSLSGTVVGIGEGVSGFKIGERVACAGAQCANHAEYVNVPVNLLVHIPASASLEHSATVALGAIALQGVRRAEPTLGETFLVIGLGILGQLTVQLLRASGCRVLGADLNEGRIALAQKNGMFGRCGNGSQLAEDARLLTQGAGVDGVILTASGGSEELIHHAFTASRKKGRVVLVGDVPLNLRREDLFEKELDFRISTSYGPGRYDRSFEEEGVDYPLPYVRWTETRNMHAFLELLASGQVDLNSLLGSVTPIEKAASAFEQLKSGGHMTALLSYPTDEKNALPFPSLNLGKHSKMPKEEGGAIPLAVLGAGSFVEGVHLPNLSAVKEKFALKWIITKTGHRARALANRYSATSCGTDWEEPLRDPATRAVLIGTRHNLHGNMTLAALTAGKHVLVEKPLALERGELERLENFFREPGPSPKPILMTGYNRRFSPAASRAKKILTERKSPVILQYTMNAGYLPLDHWVHGKEGGGRNLGEACHIYDLFLYLVGTTAVSKVKVSSLGSGSSPFTASDNFQASFEFGDGSIASLLYTAMGNSSFPKEELKAFFDHKILVIDDYKASTYLSGPGKILEEKHPSKGHAEELQAFFEGVSSGTPPISLEEQFQSCRMALMVQDELQGMRA